MSVDPQTETLDSLRTSLAERLSKIVESLVVILPTGLRLEDCDVTKSLEEIKGTIFVDNDQEVAD